MVLTGVLEIPSLAGGRPVSDADMVLAMKCLSLCELSYKPGRVAAGVDMKAIEASWISALAIKDFDFQIVTMGDLAEKATANSGSDNAKMVVTIVSTLEKFVPVVGTALAGSAAITGVLNDVNAELPGATPFVCFRGTTGLAEMLADLFSLAPAPFESKTKGFVATSGYGMVHHYRELEVKGNYLELMAQKAKTSGSNRVLVAGHSLGMVAPFKSFDSI
jgi:hypothetical protein